MKELEEFFRQKIRAVDVGNGRWALNFPMYKIEGGMYEIYLIQRGNAFILSDEGATMEELDKIMKAQKARGADFETGGLIKRAKSMIPILVPLFLSSFRRADELATAMEARCYRGDVNRTKLKLLKYQRIDYIAMVVLMMYTLLIVVTRIF